MPERDWKLFIDDIKTSINKIINYSKNLSYDKFLDDEKTIDAVVRNLEIIGEAAKKIPDNIKDKYQEIEWKKISGLRDIVIHNYFGINEGIIWDVVTNKIPELNNQIDQIIKDFSI